jgi:hypothetical protein
MKNSVTLHLCQSEVVKSNLCVDRSFQRTEMYGDSGDKPSNFHCGYVKSER